MKLGLLNEYKVCFDSMFFLPLPLQTEITWQNSPKGSVGKSDSSGGGQRNPFNGDADLTLT